MQTLHYVIFYHLGKSKVNLPANEVTSEAGIFFLSATPLLKDGIYIVKNIGGKILMYIQIVIFLKVTFFSEGIQQTNEQTKQERYFDEANEKSDNYCKWFMD